MRLLDPQPGRIFVVSSLRKKIRLQIYKLIGLNFLTYVASSSLGIRIKDLFGTPQLHQLQLSFISLTTEQLSLRVGEVVGSVWLSDQLQLQENKILVGIASYVLGMLL
jgi:hypothetical protein